MTALDPAFAAKVEELRLKQERAQEALAQVRGKGYGLNAAVVVELDASGELLRLEIDEKASEYTMASVASGVRRALADARKDAQQQVQQALGEFKADPETAEALAELQSYFGATPVESLRKATASPAAPDLYEGGYDEPPQTWLQRL